MKKSGSALVIVIVFFAALLILGTCVSAMVVNTIKYNYKHSEIIDLELIAKSGLNVAVEDVVKKIESNMDLDEIATSELKEEYNIIKEKIIGENEGVNLSLNVTKEVLDNKVVFNVVSKAKKGFTKEKIESRKVIVSLSGNITVGDNGNIFEYGILGNNIIVNQQGILSVEQTNIKGEKLEGEKIYISTNNTFEKSKITTPLYKFDKINEIIINTAQELENLHIAYPNYVKIINSENMYPEGMPPNIKEEDLKIYLINADNVILRVGENCIINDNVAILCSGNIEFIGNGDIRFNNSTIMANNIYVNHEGELEFSYSPISSNSNISVRYKDYIKDEIKRWTQDFKFSIDYKELDWIVGRTYEIGDMVIYENKRYTCITKHTSNIGWKPGGVPNIWEEID